VANAQHYVNNADLYAALKAHRKAVKRAEKDGLDHPILPRYVGECIVLICNKLSTRYNFAGYSYREEMVGDGIENCVQAAKNFDPTKSEYPFTYFTVVAFNAFVRRIGKEKKQQYVKHKNVECIAVFCDEIWEHYSGSAAHQNVNQARSAQAGLEHHYSVIEAFESSLNRKKEKGEKGGVRRAFTNRRQKRRKS